MGKYLRFEELEVWQDAMRLSKNVYAALRDCRDFWFERPDAKSCGFYSFKYSKRL